MLYVQGMFSGRRLADSDDEDEKKEDEAKEKEGGAKEKGEGEVKDKNQGLKSRTESGNAEKTEEKMDVDEVKPSTTVRTSQEEKPKDDGEEVRSKLDTKARAGQEAATEKGEGGAKEGDGGTKEGEGKVKEGEGGEKKEGDDSDDETPQYLARLLSELITGVADPQGPYRPSKPKDKDDDGAAGEGGGANEVGGGAGDEASSTADTSKAKEASSEEKEESKKDKEGEEETKEEGEGEGRRRTFAERYAGPEGTTVTISAAPAPPFGIPGLPPMEGPSLSIKNRGDGAEPEVSLSFFEKKNLTFLYHFSR